MQAKLRELLEKRNTLIVSGRDLYDKVDKEARSMTAEEKKNDDARFTEISEIGESIKRFERQIELDRESASRAASDTREAGNDDKEHRDREHRSKLVQHAERLSRVATVTGSGDSKSVRFADKGMEARASLSYKQHHESYLRGEMSMNELRGQQADVATAGGYLVAPMQMTMDLIKAVDDATFIRQWATKFLVTQSDGLGIPSLDADVADFDWTSELATGNETEMTFGRRELKPYPLAKRIKVSNKLIRTAAMDVETLVRQRLSYKFGVTEEKAFLTGSGAMQPLGLFTASADGIPTTRDVVTGSATDFTADAIYNIKYSLKGTYLSDPSTRWLFHRDGMLKIAKLKDSQNRYLWEPSFQLGQPDRLLNIPVEMSEFSPNTFTTGLYVGMLGCFRFYYIADSLNFSVQRLTELYAETNQIGFIGRGELDGMPVLSEAFTRIKTS